MNLAELALQQARRAGDAVAAQQSSASMTYAQLAEESDRVARGLRDLGVSFGDRVALFSANRLEYLVTYLAAARLGAIFAPIHPAFQTSELEYVLANLAPKVIIAEDDLWERLRNCHRVSLPSIRIVMGEEEASAGEGLVAFNDLGLGTQGSVGVAEVDPTDPVLICYTSGTTDRPHAVVRSHAGEIWNAQTYAHVWDYRPEDRALVALPLSWVWGLSTLSQALLSVGATVVLHNEFEAEAVLLDIERSGITLFAGTMSMYNSILSALTRRSYNTSSLRRLYRGGEPINTEVVAAVRARVGVPLTDAYATTEAAPILAVDPVRDLDAPAGTVGRLVPDAKIRLVDEDGRDVSPGQIGEAWLGGPGLMLGYWNEPEITAANLTPDGWFRSGDLLVEGGNGYYFLVGRSSDVIIRNGARIAPAEVESAISEMTGVRDCMVLGIPDEEFGENIVAYVVYDRACIVSEDDIYHHLSDRIARFKLPSQIHVVEQLPRKRNEKYDRSFVRQQTINAMQRAVQSNSTPLRITPGGTELRLIK
jgi:long-chain acyl-CoA synthetase